MTTVHRLTLEDARRVAVCAQLLTAERPGELLEMVRHLTLLQYEPTSAIAPSADVVAWSRLGPAYSPDELTRALDQQRLLELHSMLRPAEDLALYRAEMATWPGTGARKPWQHKIAGWVEDNTAARLDLLDRLRQDGPQRARDLPDTCVRPWRSSGWTHHKNVQRMLGFLIARGEVAVVGRDGGDRLFDLAARVYPDDPEVPLEEAMAERARRRLASLGIARAKAAQQPGEPHDVGAAGEPAEIDGVRGGWRVDPRWLAVARAGPAPRAALLSPLDRLIFDRRRMTEIFEFDYQLEMYKPVVQRRWGYWAMPVLYGDRLIGKLDATADREAGELIVHAVHEDGPGRAPSGTPCTRRSSRWPRGSGSAWCCPADDPAGTGRAVSGRTTPTSEIPGRARRGAAPRAGSPARRRRRGRGARRSPRRRTAPDRHAPAAAPRPPRPPDGWPTGPTGRRRPRTAWSRGRTPGPPGASRAADPPWAPACQAVRRSGGQAVRRERRAAGAQQAVGAASPGVKHFVPSETGTSAAPSSCHTQVSTWGDAWSGRLQLTSRPSARATPVAVASDPNSDDPSASTDGAPPRSGSAGASPVPGPDAVHTCMLKPSPPEKASTTSAAPSPSRSGVPANVGTEPDMPATKSAPGSATPRG
ncbi:MAG: crosslink repair DNA glycosylase YcaQ family protein [Nocardioides sp.]